MSAVPPITPSAATPARPRVGISVDVVEVEGALRASAALTYIDAVARAGGIPILLPPVPDLAPAFLDLCDAVVLTGGGDPRTEAFGAPTHPQARTMHPRRQEHELALLAEIRRREDLPVLGICLGMQLMCLAAGGSLIQHLPDQFAGAQMHASGDHEVLGTGPHARVLEGLDTRRRVNSRHHQGIDHPGRGLDVFARSDDGLIEGVVDLRRAFFVGVQWHPERTSDHAAGDQIFKRLIAACGLR